ncbi:MAG: flippase [Fusobacterium sp.]|nr:flippase [Fusobacterium sp.]
MIKNYIYQFIYQLINIIFPILTLPYVSKVLGAENLGMYTYSFSIITYLILVSDLGIRNYGSRKVAYCRENKGELEKFFWELLLQKFYISMLVFLLSFIYFFYTNKNEIFLIQIFYIIISFLDISWLYQGLEDFKKIMLRNLILKLFLLVLIFLFIKEKDDLLKYTKLMIIVNLLGNLILWVKIPVSNLRFKNLKPFSHLKNSFIMFLPQVAITMYTTLDRIMLGSMCDKKYVTYYDISNKMIIISMVLITTAGSVFLPKISNLYSNNEYEEIKELIKKSTNIFILIMFPLIFGILSVADGFIELLFDKTYMEVAFLMKVMSITIVFWTLNNITGSHILMPMGRENKITFSVFLGCFINLVLNYILIKKYNAFGAVIATIITEGIVTIIQIYFSKDYFQVNLKTVLKSLISAVIMFLILKYINNLYLKIFLGGISYILLILFFKEENALEIRNFLILRVKEKFL